MNEFIFAFKNYTFIRYALITGILAGIASGIIGSYVVTKRITYIAGGISHSVLAGLGAAAYCRVIFGWERLDPFYGAIFAALFAAFIIWLINIWGAKQREDTVISAVWVIGMAIGILFIFKTPGYHEDIMSYLFGNILMVSSDELWLLAVLDVFIVAAGLLFYNRLLAICFDEEFARVRGINVESYYLLLLCLIALTVVLLVKAAGIIMVIALLTLPAATAGHFVKKLPHIMLLSAFLTIIFNSLGLFISYKSDLPAGATIIVLSGAVYLAATLISRLNNLIRHMKRRREKIYRYEKL